MITICDRRCKNWPSECKNSWFFLFALITIYITSTKASLLLQNLMGFFCNWWKWDTAFWMEDISKNITRCNLHAHGRFSQARSHIHTSHILYRGTLILVSILASVSIPVVFIGKYQENLKQVTSYVFTFVRYQLMDKKETWTVKIIEHTVA